MLTVDSARISVVSSVGVTPMGSSGASLESRKSLFGLVQQNMVCLDWRYATLTSWLNSLNTTMLLNGKFGVEVAQAASSKQIVFPSDDGRLRAGQ